MTGSETHHQAQPFPAGDRPRAVIIGGSMGGLFAALLLRRAGWDVAIYERNGMELAGRGAGVVTHAELFDVLERAGVKIDANIGVRVPGRRVLDRQGNIVGELALDQILTSWGRLYSLLRAVLPAADYHHGKNLVRVEETVDEVTAHFEDGAHASGDLLIGADGLFSTVRAQFDPQARPAYAGYVAWRGLVEEGDLSQETRTAIGDHFAFCLPPGEQILGYPIAGAEESIEPGRRRFNFVWYRPAEEHGRLAGLLTDVDGFRHELSIPPHKIRPEVLETMRRDADRLLAPAFAEVVRRTEQPFIQAILDLKTPRMVVGRRSVLLGDAAFVARPHVGMGVTKAAGDAAALVAAIQHHPQDLGAAFQRFEAARLPFGAAVVRHARQLGAYMQAQILTEEERRLAERHRQPQAVMAETAVATQLDQHRRD
jgi:2-polyprenyl-6-methoxyphenol hydroxylase-like FAD-dependent oxidoreductase